MPSYNCSCEDDWDTKTLAELRTDMLVRLGFAAQAANPPPGMAALMDSFLQDAQEQLYRRYRSKRISRFFRWTMTAGERFYGITANAEKTDDPECLKELDPHSIQWVGVQDLNNTWYPLIQGIPPEAYTRAQATTGWPTRYEVRSCIEVFPAPRAAYTLRVKGLAKLGRFTENADQTTLHYHPVFLLALGNAKAHYGRPDAGNYFTQANSFVGALVAGTHDTARYVPHPRGQREALTPPIMTEYIE